MEHVYREMLRNLLKKKYYSIKQKKKRLNVGEESKIELILELYDYLGFGDINEKMTPTPDEIMIALYKRDHWHIEQCNRQIRTLILFGMNSEGPQNPTVDVVRQLPKKSCPKFFILDFVVYIITIINH